MNLYKELVFESAHQFPHVPDGHQGGRLHGHLFSVEVHVTDPVDEITGCEIEFSETQSADKPILNRLDHYYLNEIEVLENPTSENIAIWIWRKLKPPLPPLFNVVSCLRNLHLRLHAQRRTRMLWSSLFFRKALGQ